MLFIPVMAKLICWFGAQETFLIIIHVENSAAFVETFLKNES